MAIIDAFPDEAARRGQRAGIVILPTGLDLEHRVSTGKWVHAPLLARLSRPDLEIIDLGDPMVIAVADKNPCTLFRRDCRGHYSRAGYALVADVVAGAIAKRVSQSSAERLAPSPDERLGSAF